MSEIESPLGKKSFTSTPRQVFKVENTEEDFGPADLGPPDNFIPDDFPKMQPGVPVELTPAQFQALQSKRAELIAAQKKASPDARQRIEILSGIGRVIKEFPFEGHTFTLQSLKPRDLKEILKAAAESSSVEFNFIIRAHTLAYSLIKIDGHDLGLILGNNSLEAKLELLDNMDEGLIAYIHSKYGEMNKEHQQKFGVKDEKDAKEVVEQTKKL